MFRYCSFINCFYLRTTRSYCVKWNSTSFTKNFDLGKFIFILNLANFVLKLILVFLQFLLDLYHLLWCRLGMHIRLEYLSVLHLSLVGIWTMRKIYQMATCWKCIDPYECWSLDIALIDRLLGVAGKHPSNPISKNISANRSLMLGIG